MAFDFSKLRGRIVEKFGSLTAFSNEIGMSNVVLSAKMNGKVRFTSDDIVNFTEKLEINPEEIGIYFFTLKVSKS